MPEIISTPHALVQTTNGKRFYVNSGLVSVDNNETSVIDIENIGERDIKFKLNPILTAGDHDDMRMKVKNNGSIIYECVFTSQYALNSGLQPLHFIFAANTSLQITFTNVDSSSHNVGVSCYGKFMSM